MRKRTRVTFSNFVCPECGFKFPLPRYRMREKGHIKDLYCPKCRKVQKMTEIREIDCVVVDG